jgi:hypothetical protein
LLGDTAALYLSSVEVSHHGGSADVKPLRELHDRAPAA